MNDVVIIPGDSLNPLLQQWSEFITQVQHASVWYNGSGAPSPALGLNGDYYLDVDSSNVYSKVAGNYTLITNIQGEHADVALSTYANLPTAGNQGKLTKLTNENRGLWVDTGTAWSDINGHHYNVQLFGANPVTDALGQTNSTSAFQAAITAAITNGGGWVIIPSPPAGSFYVLTDTILVNSPPNQFINVGIRGLGSASTGNSTSLGSYIRWRGAGYKSIFLCSGLFRSVFESLHIYNDGNAANVTFLDFRPTYKQKSATRVRVNDCDFSFGTGGGNIGIRTGQTDPTGVAQDNSFFQFDHCSCSGIANTNGDVAFQIGGGNTQPNCCNHCSASNVNTRWLMGPYFTLVASGHTVNPGDNTITVNSTAGFPSKGLLSFAYPPLELVSYTGISGNTFTGVTRSLCGTAAGTWSTGTACNFWHSDTPNFTVTSGAVTTGASTINVNSTTGFPSSGFIQLVPSNTYGGTASEIIAYTGTTATSFTGCKRAQLGSSAVSVPGSNYVVCEYKYGPSMGQIQPSNIVTWIGGGGTGNQLEYMIYGGGTYTLIGDHAETGQRYLQAGTGTSGSFAAITLIGCNMDQMGPADSVIMYCYLTVNLTIIGNTWTRNVSSFWGTSMLILNGGNSNGIVYIRGCVFQALDPFYTTGSSAVNWRITIEDCSQVQNNVLLKIFTNPGARFSALTDAATVNIAVSDRFIYFLAMTSGVGTNRILTVSNTYQGQKFSLHLQQTSSGGPYTVTWFSNIKWVGGSPPTLSSGANAVDVIDFEVTNINGTLYYLGNPSLNYS